MKTKFLNKLKIIDYYNCKSLDIKEGVTTMGDECSPVGQILSLSEVRSTHCMCEEIV